MNISSRILKIPLIAFAVLLLGGTAFLAFNGKPGTPAKTDHTPRLAPKTVRRAQVAEAPKLPKKQMITVKGLHVTGWIAGGKNSLQHLIDLCNTTELNALCIDIKDSDGVVSFDTHVSIERQIHASRKCIGNIDEVMKKLKDNHIYAIARIAVFKDPILAKWKPEMAVHSAGGGVWRDHKGISWANPYDKRVWDYNIDLAKECIKLGFNEIQWDYVRFPSDGNIHACVYPGRDKRTESELIASFLKYAHKQLEPYNVVMSADIFGLTSLVKHDMGIGQTIQMIAQNVDYICPMVYPSHYALGEYHIPNPNKEPYKTVLLSLGDAVKKVKGTNCKIRPWLQDFSLYGVHYGPAEVLAQRKAAKEVGLTEFLLWNPRCKYTESALSRSKDSQKTASASPNH